jgi:glycosyltransferase involved in cell wall biosynthesis
MPAYNAAKTLEKTYRDIPMDCVWKIILVDDVSSDETVDIARKLGVKVIVHMQNTGYGGNQKTCYIEALKEGADIVVMLHPDYQYDSRLIPAMIAPIREGRCDMVLGSRMLDGKAREGGMPLYKFILNRMLTLCQSLIYGQRFTDLHTGFRAYSRELLETVPFLLNSNDFVFDSEMIAQAVAFNFRLMEVAVPARYFPEASSVHFWVSLRYGLKTLWVMLKYTVHRMHIKRVRQFRLGLKDIVSQHYHSELFRTGETAKRRGDDELQRSNFKIAYRSNLPNPNDYERREKY